jgi:hypothetical protein
MVWLVDFYTKQIFKTMSITATLALNGGCAQDSMIRINSTSALTLVPNIEIRYKTCGDSFSGCQAVFNSMASEKAKLITLAHTKAQQEMYRKIQLNTEKIKLCNDSDRNSMYVNKMNSTAVRQSMKEEGCHQIGAVVTNDYTVDENNFTPTAEDIKKIVKEVSNNSLNEYTFSKADGSIIVICPTRYCAISSGEGSWLGIGERGQSIKSTLIAR